MRFFLETDHPAFPIVEVDRYYMNKWQFIKEDSLVLKQDDLYENFQYGGRVFCFLGPEDDKSNFLNLKNNIIFSFWSEEW